eukprot:4222536-Alexandrium_andersonii.AAC.1
MCVCVLSPSDIRISRPRGRPNFEASWKASDGCSHLGQAVEGACDLWRGSGDSIIHWGVPAGSE